MTLEFNCPKCARALDQSHGTHSTPEPPSPGDLNLCGHCGCVAVFDNSPTGLHIARLEEIEALDPEEKAELTRAIGLIVARGRLNESASNARP